jgi:hypothetical protein
MKSTSRVDIFDIKGGNVTSRDQLDRELRRFLREQGVDPMPPDEEIREVVEFFAQPGTLGMRTFRRTLDEMARAHHQQGQNRARPPSTVDEAT